MRAGADALAAAVEECRLTAASLKARDFAAFTVAAGAERRLQPCLVGGDASAFLPQFLGRHDGEVARHALASSAPFWWVGEDGSAGLLGLQDLHWAVQGRFDGLPTSGVGFPCATERGACGAILFWGAGIELSAESAFALHARLFGAFEALASVRPKGSAALPAISKRELECLALTAKGLTSEDIAEALGFSAHTANQHMAAAAAKLDAVNRMQAVAKALRLGLID